MARWATVGIVQYINHANDLRKGRERVREIWETLIDRVALDEPDILLLPELFLTNGLKNAEGRALMDRDVAEPVPGGGFVQDFLVRKARQYRMYVAAGMVRLDPATNRIYNSAVLFDRAGAVAGIYDKMFPTPGEMEKYEVTPGAAPGIFDTDFGRIGIAICFDLNFPEVFAPMRERGVELCCFLSSMHGGTHLPTLAYEGRMYLASAVEHTAAYIINPIGGIVRRTGSCGNGVAARINLDYQLFHQAPPNLAEHIKRAYRNTVRFECVEGGPWKLLVCDREDRTAADVMKEFGVKPLDVLLDHTRALRQARLTVPAAG